MSVLMLDDAEIIEITYPNQWDTLKTHGLAANAKIRELETALPTLLALSRAALEVADEMRDSPEGLYNDWADKITAAAGGGAMTILSDEQIKAMDKYGDEVEIYAHGLAANAELRDRDRTIERLRGALEEIAEQKGMTLISTDAKGLSDRGINLDYSEGAHVAFEQMAGIAIAALAEGD